MPLSLESIHQPLNDFFLDQFATGAGSPIVFRFDKFGSVISKGDYRDPNNAMENFSALVSCVPIESPDGLNVFDSQTQIDESYTAMLQPAVPFVAEDVIDDVRQQIVDSFNQLKVDAKTAFENITRESSSGLMMQFKPSLASPGDWYDQTNGDNWTSHSFEISQTQAPGPGAEANTQLWKKQVEDAVSRAASSINHIFAAAAAVAPQPASQPSAATDAESASISFDYCLVKIRRPWYDEAFIQSPDWYIPGTPKGTLTAPAAGRVHMTVLPVALVVIRNLNIRAHWSAADIENAKDATGFGPFTVTGGIADGSLTHTGMQVIGWLLERMPALPPNDPPKWFIPEMDGADAPTETVTPIIDN